MELRQDFRFVAEPQQIREFLRSLASEVQLDDRGDFFVFSAGSPPAFEFDCGSIHMVCSPSGLVDNAFLAPSAIATHDSVHWL